MVNLILKAIQKKLIDGFAGEYYREPGGIDSFISPHIFITGLPAKRSTEDQGNDFPYIIVRAGKGMDDDNESYLEVFIVCGTFSALHGAEVEAAVCQNMVDHCRYLLLSDRTLIQKHPLELPLQYGVELMEEEEGIPPYYLGVLGTRWTMDKIVDKIQSEGDRYE
jgi:hypothetical protein